MLGPKYLYEMFVVYDSAYDMRNSMNIVIPKFNTVKYGKKSISYTGVKLWTILNTETKQTVNIKAFRRFIMLWNGSICSCFNCTHCSLKCMSFICHLYFKSQNHISYNHLLSYILSVIIFLYHTSSFGQWFLANDSYCTCTELI